MSALDKATNFALMMFRDKQHPYFRCCKIAAEYYDVDVEAVKSNISSRAGLSSKGRKYKFCVEICQRNRGYSENYSSYYYAHPVKRKVSQKNDLHIEHYLTGDQFVGTAVFATEKEATEFRKQIMNLSLLEAHELMKKMALSSKEIKNNA